MPTCANGSIRSVRAPGSHRAGAEKPVPDCSPISARWRFFDQNFIAARCVQRAQVGIQVSRIALRIRGSSDPRCALVADRSRAKAQDRAVLPCASLPLVTRDEPQRLSRRVVGFQCARGARFGCLDD